MGTQYSGSTITAINFGFHSTALGITISGITGWLIQNGSHTKNADVYEVRDGDGDVVQRTFYNFNDDASLECIITDATNQAGAITNTTSALQTPGTIISITACAAMPSLVATNWQVESGIEISGSITDAKKVVCKLKKHAGITASNS